MTGNVATGIQGLDELISGGFPEGRIILVVGGPGAGKTILASQFLYKGIYEHNEKGVLVSLDEGKNHFFSEMQNFGWDFKKAQEEGKFVFIDATRISRIAILKEKMYKQETSSLRGKQLPIDKLVEELQAKIQQIDAKRVAFDSMTMLFHRFPDPLERRVAIVDLVESLSELGITTIVTTELSRLGPDRDILVEEYLVHGVIIMQTLFSQETMTRALHIQKMRGTKVISKRVPYTIDITGIEVFSNLRLFG